MASLNSCHFIGNVVADPEVRDLGEHKVCKLRLAVNGRKYKAKDGSDVEEVLWLDVQAWNKVAELWQQYLVKGSKVRVSGDMRTESWEDKTSGEKRSKQTLNCTDFEFLGGKGKDETNNGEVVDKPKTSTRGRPKKASSEAPKSDHVDNGGDIPF